MTNSNDRSLWTKYKGPLNFLRTDPPLVTALNQVGIHHGWWKTERSWGRKFSRFNPGETPFVWVMFETRDKPQEICLLEFLEDTSVVMDGPGFVVKELTETWCRIVRFPADPKLPSLPSVLGDPIGEPTVIRYRPGKRCTIRFDAYPPESSCFAKVFPDQCGEQIHKESIQLWEASINYDVKFSTASPLRWDADRQTIWQGMVKGDPILPQLCDQGAIEMVSRVASAIASITRSNLSPGIIFNGQAQMSRTEGYVKKLNRRVPSLSSQVGELVDALSRTHQSCETNLLFPIHGAPHAHQWLDDGQRLGLVDFDRFALGDRELDVATFLTELEWEGKVQPKMHQIKETFLSTYESAAGSLNPLLLWAYRAHKYLARAYKATHGVRPDGVERASRAIQQAFPIPAGLS